MLALSSCCKQINQLRDKYIHLLLILKIWWINLRCVNKVYTDLFKISENWNLYKLRWSVFRSSTPRLNRNTARSVESLNGSAARLRVNSMSSVKSREHAASKQHSAELLRQKSQAPSVKCEPLVKKDEEKDKLIQEEKSKTGVVSNKEQIIHGYPIDGAGQDQKLSMVCLHNNAFVARGIRVTRLHCARPWIVPQHHLCCSVKTSFLSWI